MAFKMKGSPMQRNFGISPIKSIKHGAGTEWEHVHNKSVRHEDGAAAHNKKAKEREKEVINRFHGAGGTIVDKKGDIIE